MKWCRWEESTPPSHGRRSEGFRAGGWEGLLADTVYPTPKKWSTWEIEILLSEWTEKKVAPSRR